MYLENKPRALVVSNNSKQSLPVSGTLGGQAVVDMVRQEAELQLAREKGLYPTDGDVQQEIEFRKRQNPSFLLELEAQGLTLDVIRRELVAELAEERLLTQGVHVSTEQAKAYVHSHPNESRRTREGSARAHLCSERLIGEASGRRPS